MQEKECCSQSFFLRNVASHLSLNSYDVYQESDIYAYEYYSYERTNKRTSIGTEWMSERDPSKIRFPIFSRKKYFCFQSWRKEIQSVQCQIKAEHHQFNIWAELSFWRIDSSRSRLIIFLKKKKKTDSTLNCMSFQVNLRYVEMANSGPIKKRGDFLHQ